MGFLPLYLYECISGAGSGGGGGATYAWITQTFPQVANFSSGITLTLSQLPADADAVELDYNGRMLRQGVEYSIASNIITILFADPDVTTYDNTPYFQARYPYTV